MKKNKETILHRTKEEESLRQIHILSMELGSIANIGTGVHKNKKYDKKIRRNEGKKICRDY